MRIVKKIATVVTESSIFCLVATATIYGDHPAYDNLLPLYTFHYNHLYFEANTTEIRLISNNTAS